MTPKEFEALPNRPVKVMIKKGMIDVINGYRSPSWAARTLRGILENAGSYVCTMYNPEEGELQHYLRFKDGNFWISSKMCWYIELLTKQDIELII